MKINLIYSNLTPNIVMDLQILKLLFKKFKEKIEIVETNVIGYKCNDSTINVFFNYVNLQYLNNAKTNILIFEHTSFQKEWLETLPLVDVIFTKTNQSYTTLKSYLSQTDLKCNIVNIGWKVPNIFINYEKDYDEILLFCDKDFDYNKIITGWDVKYPNLNVVLDKSIKIDKKIQDNIIYHIGIKSEEFHKLFSLCGVHICLRQHETYDTFISQGKLAKSIIIGFNNSELLKRDFSYTLPPIKKKNKFGMGYSYNFDENELFNVIFKIQNSSEDHLRCMSKLAVEDAVKLQTEFEELFKVEMKKIMEKSKTIKFNKTILEDDNLPNITIITPTYNRFKMFRLPIFIYNTMDYPKNKMEWIIIDDSEEDEKKLENLIPDREHMQNNNMDINYIKLDKKITIGAKRNMGCELAKHDIILFMDDDDYYYNTSFKKRVNALINSEKSCVGTSTFGCFEINRYISLLNVYPIDMPASRKPSIASLCFYKKYWNNNRFIDINKNEANNFIDIEDYCDISWEDNFISLVHSGNVMKDKITYEHNKNGCQYNFSKKLFNFLITLDKNSDLIDSLRKE